MTTFFERLLRRLRGDPKAPERGGPSAEHLPEPLLDQARRLAGAGELHEASRAYSKVLKRYHPPEVLLEHAQVLLRMGDVFKAASYATRVLETDPGNVEALAVRRAVLELEKVR